ncbi:MAG: queuosine precursor transporter [Spirochaetes bacterium]|nr:queuosine precursor transporter [Spirochaetota bacterium]
MNDKQPMQLSATFLVITSLFVTCLLITNIVAGRLVQIFGLTITADLFLFPVTYIFGDVLTEVYGYRKSRITIWLGFGSNLLMALIFLSVIQMPVPGFWQDGAAYTTVLGANTPRIVAASLAAYFCGEFSNSMILSKLKIATNGRFLWLRTIGSTLVGQSFDTGIFMTIAFWGMFPIEEFISMTLVQYVWKVSYEILATPVTYYIISSIKKKDRCDTYDKGISYNPFPGLFRE